MHNVVRHFSDKARQTVVDLFSDPTKVEQSLTGLVVMYEDIFCCPIGLALRVDGKDDFDDDVISIVKKYTPDSARIAECLTGSRDSQEAQRIEKEARAFINGVAYHGHTVEETIEAFRISEKPTDLWVIEVTGWEPDDSGTYDWRRHYFRKDKMSQNTAVLYLTKQAALKAIRYTSYGKPVLVNLTTGEREDVG